MFVGGIQFDEVVEPALVERSVAFEIIDLVQTVLVGDFEDFAFDLIAVRGMAVAKKGQVGHDQFAQFGGLCLAKECSTRPV